MGVIADIADRIVKAFANSPEKRVLRLVAGDPYSDVYTGYGYDLQGHNRNALYDYLRLDSDILERYQEAEYMDEYPELASALDIFADDSTQPDLARKRTLWATSKQPKVANELNAMLRRIKADTESWEIARTLAKFGNDMEELLIDGSGVIGLHFLHPATMRRVEGRYGELYGYMQDPRARLSFTVGEWQQAMQAREASGLPGHPVPTEPLVAFDDYEVVHFRLRTKYRQSVYGLSLLDPARWIWRRLVLLEDSAMIYRLHRAPERLAFNINVGNKDGAEARAELMRYQRMYRKKKFVDPQTGKLSVRADVLSPDDNVYLGFREGSDPSSVDILQSPVWQSVEDLEYFRQKLFAAIKIPAAYLGDPDGLVRSTLSAMDARFARTVLRLQRALLDGWVQVGRTHLAALGIPLEKAPFEMEMTPPSAIMELAQIEARAARADLAGRMGEFVSMHWILANIFNLPEEEIREIFVQRHEDVVRGAKSEADAQEIMAPPPPPDEAGAPGSNETYEARRLVQDRYALSRGLRATGWQLPSQRSLGRLGGRLSEQELFQGSRAAEREARSVVEQLRETNKGFEGRIRELSGLLGELRASRRSSMASRGGARR